MRRRDERLPRAGEHSMPSSMLDGNEGGKHVWGGRKAKENRSKKKIERIEKNKEHQCDSRRWTARWCWWWIEIAPVTNQTGSSIVKSGPDCRCKATACNLIIFLRGFIDYSTGHKCRIVCERESSNKLMLFLSTSLCLWFNDPRWSNFRLTLISSDDLERVW